MAGKPEVSASNSAEGTLATSDVVDAADTSPRGPAPDTSGRRVRAIPYQGGSTVVVNAQDFAAHNIDNGRVEFDFRIDHFTLPVGTGDSENLLTEAGAAFLTKKYPETFEYMDS